MSYDAATIRQLNTLTSEFYAREAASFSAPRQSPWHGWERAWDAAAAADPTLARRALSVLDLGCGNLRFERFLAERAGGPLAVTAVDNCTPLVKDGRQPAPRPASPQAAGRQRASADSLDSAVPPHAKQGPAASERAMVDFRPFDIVESLLDGSFANRLPYGTCDLAVAFGLMHHLPTFALRTEALAALLRSLRPGGFAIASFWQFLNDARLAGKAAAVTDEGRAAHSLPPFGPGDHLLGWQHAEGIYRFCHHTGDNEIDDLLTAIRADPDTPPFREVARFSDDGKQDNLNRYVVLRRCEPQAASLC